MKNSNSFSWIEPMKNTCRKLTWLKFQLILISNFLSFTETQNSCGKDTFHLDYFSHNLPIFSRRFLTGGRTPLIYVISDSSVTCKFVNLCNCYYNYVLCPSFHYTQWKSKNSVVNEHKDGILFHYRENVSEINWLNSNHCRQTDMEGYWVLIYLLITQPLIYL